MSLQGLVDATATSLDGARALFGQPVPASGLPSTSGLQSLKTDLRAAVDTVPASWSGGGGEGYKTAGGNGVAALDNVVGADRGVGPQVVTASNESRDGRSGMNNVVSDTRAGVNAIAPSTDTPAGKTVLVNHLEGQLDRAKALLTKSQQRGQMLATMIRSAGSGYGAPMGGGGMPMGGMPMPGGMGGGMSPLGSLSALSGLTGALPGLSGSSSARRGAMGRGAAPPSSAARIAVGDVSFAGRGTFPKGPAAMSEAIDAALDARGVTDPVARKRWHDGYMTLTGRESGHNASVVNVSDSNAHGAQMSDGAPANSSRGPAQCIPTTFAGHHQPGTSTSIYEPVANIAASMNYVMDRYGVSPDGSNLASRVPQANYAVRGGGY
ncbi:hypothetical protein MMAD_56620 (plasmid) [Mycolicibacterium madagascariense]|uniref:Transglycosylase SLT domain-containing protein n=1 Tax=Mycolicibacterium madagascariense TaxID=212765 RepID=A0A7I7XQ36_9MYCO|nr:hypothetical protein [Mycolicibacterium madagascariense]BBZ31367.1 hypothetical protein MMAD_56620 [Mycolicibacterium madagascariense]